MNTTTTPNMKLKGGYGYWTNNGITFLRAPEEGKPIVAIVRTFKQTKGLDTEVRFTDGTLGVLRRAHIDFGCGCGSGKPLDKCCGYARSESL